MQDFGFSYSDGPAKSVVPVSMAIPQSPFFFIRFWQTFKNLSPI